MSINSMTVSGWVKFFEKKITTSGKTVCKFQVSVKNPKREGDTSGKATYTNVRCQYWGDLDLEDGCEVLAHGGYYSSSYVAKDGTKRYDTGLNVKTLAKITKGSMGEMQQASAPEPEYKTDEDIPF